MDKTRWTGTIEDNVLLRRSWKGITICRVGWGISSAVVPVFATFALAFALADKIGVTIPPSSLISMLSAKNWYAVALKNVGMIMLMPLYHCHLLDHN